MSGVAQRVSSGVLVADSVAQRIDAIRQEAAIAVRRAPRVAVQDQRAFDGAILRARRRDARVVGLIPSSAAAPPWP